MNTKEKPNTLNLILKFSNRGIEETILEQLESVAEKIKQSYEIIINILITDVGDTTSGDIKNAKLSNAEIISFGVGIAPEADQAISENNIIPKRHDLIHTFLKDIEDIALKRKRNSIKGV
jgi:translation initiation factor IF-2